MIGPPAGVKVLVVDDEPDSRLLIKRLLEDCNARVLVAASVAPITARGASRSPMAAASWPQPELNGAVTGGSAGPLKYEAPVTSTASWSALT